MKGKRVLMMLLVVMVGVIGNGKYHFADDDTSPVPLEGKMLLEYEGNDSANSYNYYRLSVKFGAESKAVKTVPESLVIYETNMTPGKEGKEVAVHKVEFGKDAGRILQDLGDKPYLDKFNAFYYRNIMVDEQAMGKYQYKVVATWKDLKTGQVSVRTAQTTVSVSQKVYMQSVMIGSANNFSRSKWIGNYDQGAKFVPKEYEVDGKVSGYSSAYKGEDQLGQEEQNMDKLWGGSPYININNAPVLPGVNNKKIDQAVFIANASLETHVVYTGKQDLNKNIKVYIDNPQLINNSRELGSRREVPALSEVLTRLARAPQIHKDYPSGIYPKDHTEVFMGKGTGPQGDINPGDKNRNNVSFILGNINGTIHEVFELLVVDADKEAVFNEENPNSTIGYKVQEEGFVFDFIKVTYNPVIFVDPVEVKGDAFVKPEGYLILNTKINMNQAILGANLDTSMTKEEKLAAGKVIEAEMRISLKDVLDSELNQYTQFTNTNGDGLDFNGSQMNLAVGGKKIEECTQAACDHEKGEYNCQPNTYVYDEGQKQIYIHRIGEAGVFMPKADYQIKLIIPTKRKNGAKTVTQYNDEIVGDPKNPSKPGKTFPLIIEVLQDNPISLDEKDKMLRYRITNTIKPYKMPGIN